MQIADAVRVVHAAVGVDHVLVRRPVLGHVERDARRERGVVEEQVGEAGRIHGPVHGGEFAGRVVEEDVVGGRPRGVLAGAVPVEARAVLVGAWAGDDGRRVVVQADEVERLVDRRGVTVPHERPVRDGRGVGEEVARIGALEQRPGEDPVRERVDPAPGVLVLGALGERPDHTRVQADADLGAGRQHAAQGRSGKPVTEVEVVRRAQGGRRVRPPRGVHPGAVAQEGAAPGLVERHPALDAVAERLADEPRVLREPVGGVPLGPAARVLQLLRQVPVVERHHGLDPVGEQLVHEPPVEVESTLHGGPAPGGLHPRPRHGEAVGGQPQVGHQPHVVAPPVVVVHGDVPRVAVQHLPRRMAERVPDRRRPPVLPHGPLDLIRGSGRPQRNPAGNRVATGAALRPVLVLSVVVIGALP